MSTTTITRCCVAIKQNGMMCGNKPKMGSYCGIHRNIAMYEQCQLQEKQNKKLSIELETKINQLENKVNNN
jgi:hypothetical protein